MRNTPEQGGSVTDQATQTWSDKRRRADQALVDAAEAEAIEAVRLAEEEDDGFDEDPWSSVAWDDPDSLDWEPEPIIVERPGPASTVRVPTNYRAAIRQARAERRAA
jgi:hypothetical protein